MGIFTHFLAASDANKMLTTEEVEAFVADLLCEQMVAFPAALLVGEARSMAPFHWEGVAGEYEAHRNLFIVPNTPKAMQYYVYQDNSSDLLWYHGSDQQALFALLKQLPLGEKDCCICFSRIHKQLVQMGWEDATIYLLTRPFPMEFCDPMGTSLVTVVDRPLAHYFVLYSSMRGATMDQMVNPLEPILKRYFGLHLLTGENF